MVIGVGSWRLDKNPALLQQLAQVRPEIARVISRKQSTSPVTTENSEDSDEEARTQDAAVAISDLFGRIEIMNAEMITLCSQYEFDAGQQNLTDLLSLLLPGGRVDARDVVANVVQASETIVCRIPSTTKGVRKFLQLSPIRQPADPFGVEVVCLAVFEAPNTHDAHISDHDLAEQATQPVLQNAARLWAKSADASMNQTPDMVAEEWSWDPSSTEFVPQETQEDQSVSSLVGFADLPMHNWKTSSPFIDGPETDRRRHATRHEKQTHHDNSLQGDPLLLLGQALLDQLDQVQQRDLDFEFADDHQIAMISVPVAFQKRIFETVVQWLLAHTQPGSDIRVEVTDAMAHLEIRITGCWSTDDENKIKNPDAEELAKQETWEQLGKLRDDLSRFECRLQVTSREGAVTVSVLMPASEEAAELQGQGTPEPNPDGTPGLSDAREAH